MTKDEISKVFNKFAGKVIEPKSYNPENLDFKPDPTQMEIFNAAIKNGLIVSIAYLQEGESAIQAREEQRALERAFKQERREDRILLFAEKGADGKHRISPTFEIG